jgi:hypothetical protein
VRDTLIHLTVIWALLGLACGATLAVMGRRTRSRARFLIALAAALALWVAFAAAILIIVTSGRNWSAC